METIILSKKKFNSLEPLNLDKSITNSEGLLFKYYEKNKWKKTLKLLKKLKIDSGDTFGNKLATLTSLMTFKDKLKTLDIVIPEKFVVVDKNLSAFTMPYIDGTNLKLIINNPQISNQVKIDYLKQVGKLFESLHNFRQYSNINDFYLNDVHEANFVVDNKTNKVIAVDIDSARINANKPFKTKYLNWAYIRNHLENKYKPYDSEREVYVADENSDIFCYCIMLLNFFYGDDFYKLSLIEFYNYLQYLEDIEFPKKLLEIFSHLYTIDKNENPYLYLDELPKNISLAKKEQYKKI